MTDLLAGFLAVFIILFIAAQNQRARGPVQTRMQIASRIRDALVADTVEVKTYPEDSTALLIVMPNELLFDEGSSKLKDSGRVVLQRMSPKIAKVLCGIAAWRDSVSITIEGHTDAVPGPRALLSGITSVPDGRLANLVLSQARAASVSAVMVESVTDPDERNCLYLIASASGRGQEQPADGSTRLATDSVRAEPRDRRVWLIIRVTKSGLESAQNAATGVPSIVPRE